MAKSVPLFCVCNTSPKAIKTQKKTTKRATKKTQKKTTKRAKKKTTKKSVRRRRSNPESALMMRFGL